MLSSSSDKDSVCFILPLSEKTIYISNETDVIDEYYNVDNQKYASKTIVLELVLNEFKRKKESILLPNIRYVPEDKEIFAELIFPLK